MRLEAGSLHKREHRVEVVTTLRAQMVADARRPVEHRAAALHFAVEGAQRVGLQTLPAFAAQPGLVRLQILAQPNHVLRPAGAVAHAVHAQAHALHAELAEQSAQQGDDLSVDGRV